MNKVFENIIFHYHYVWERYAGRTISIGSLGGAIYTGTIAGDGPEKPRLRDTAMLTGYGAVMGGFGSFLLLCTYPVSIPVAAFVGPIHLYNKYKFESKLNNVNNNHELK